MCTQRRVQEYELEILNQNIDREERRIRKEIKAKKKLDMAGLGEENPNMGEAPQDQHLPVDFHRQSIQDMCRPTYADFRQGVPVPPIQANNFELKPSYIQLVQNEQFGGGSSEDPMNHLRKVELVSKLIKLNGVTQDAISMRLFPFLLRGKALSWYERLNSATVVSWNDLCNTFLGEFYPPSLYMHYRSELTNFRRKTSETLYESWERYKDLIDKCPNH